MIYKKGMKVRSLANIGEFQNGKYDKEHPLCIVGLILGYPIENTMSLYRNN